MNTRKENGYYVSKDHEKLKLSEIIKLLHQSSWAKDRSEEEIKKSVENSVCYGVYDDKDHMVGFARIITDYTRVFYLMDVIIDEAHRHQGLGTMLMDKIMEDVGDLYGILHTEDTKGFYEKYGFSSDLKSLECTMEKKRR